MMHYINADNVETLDLKIKRILFSGNYNVVFSGDKHNVIFTEQDINIACPSVTCNFNIKIDGEEKYYSRCNVLELSFKRTAYTYEAFVGILKLDLKTTKIEIDYCDADSRDNYYEVFYIDPQKFEVEISEDNLLVKIYSKDNWDIPYDKSVIKETL